MKTLRNSCPEREFSLTETNPANEPYIAEP